MATAVQNFTGSDAEEQKPKYGIGVLAGLEWSPVKNAELNVTQKNAVKDLFKKAARRDYPARLVEVITAWEAALFYRGFQFLLPQRGGGWVIPGESTGYGPSMQMDLALLPTNIYSARAQMIIAALTRTVPNAIIEPQEGTNDAQITAAESGEKFLKVIRRNNDLIMIQTDASRYLWTDGRFGYWSRFVKDGQKFGWEEDDTTDDIVPEDEPPDGAVGTTPVEATADMETPESSETAAEEPSSPVATEETVGDQETQQDESEEEAPEAPQKRTPRGQEVRTVHGKLEMKIVPMMASTTDEIDVLMLDYEVDISRAKGMFPWICDEIRPGAMAISEGEIAKLARQNVKLGMQSTYITSDSMANDVTISRAWFRPSDLMQIGDEVLRDELIEMFPNGMLLCYAGEVLAYARNESMDDSWAIGHAYSGDGQNRNAMGTSTMPIQKRLNNWLDLMNDYFIRAIPKKWMDNKTFNVEATRGQTNIPGDVAPFKFKPGVTMAELVFVEPVIVPPPTLADFIKEYSGPLAELLSGAYPALAGGDVGTADSGVAIATQRDSALGRLAPTWHSIKNCEAISSGQLIRWGAKCRDKSINEKIPGGEIITLEINDLKANIMVYAESDENIPETFTQKKNGFMQIFDSAVKNPQVGEVFFNGANLKFLKSVSGLKDLYIPQVAAYEKQLGEIDIIMKGNGPVPNPLLAEMTLKLETMQSLGVDPMEIQQLQQQLQAVPPEITSFPIDAQVDDSDTEAATCWQIINNSEGRKWKRTKPQQFADLRLHFLAHQEAAQAKATAAGGAGKPPSVSIGWKDVAQIDKGASDQILQKAGVMPSPGAQAPPPVPAPAGEKAPAEPHPVGSPEGAGGQPKK